MIEHRLDELLRELGETSFSVRVNVASSHAAVRVIIASDALVLKIVAICKKDRFAIGVVADYGRSLSSRAVDPRYESPWDAALTAVLVILQTLDWSIARATAHFVSKAPQTWWARRESAAIIESDWIALLSANIHKVMITIGVDGPGMGLRFAPEVSIAADAFHEALLLSSPNLPGPNREWSVLPAEADLSTMLEHESRVVYFVHSLKGDWQAANWDYVKSAETLDLVVGNFND